LAESIETIDRQNMFNNSGLFSNHYLENLIQKVPEWDDDADLQAFYSEIRDIYQRKSRNFEKYVEADLEHNWIRPVLDRLGHHYGVQESVHQDPLKPDYAFFPDKNTLDEAYSYKHKKDSEGFYKKAVVVGDAKAWNVALDKSRLGKALREKANPSLQIDNYLRATPAKWAILTNGRLWRLYHEDTSVKLDCFYEVNLPSLIDLVERSGDLTAFKYFYLFFRREAFPEAPLGPSFLDRVRQESLSYAQKIGSDLQENVYRAMKILAEGFFAEPSNSLSHSKENIRDVQENSMRLLYRLLFIFYAESRKLLNTDKKSYREMSLLKLKDEVAEKLDQGEAMPARSTYWAGLLDLFRLINDGSEAFGYSKEDFYIPAYNGGLFDPEKNSFLSSKKIGNSYLALAIDLLARSEGERGAAFVDYSSLDIRHLGSIYEGILEYRLHLAEESMVAVKEKGKEVWLAEREAEGRKAAEKVEAGRLYLVTDKGERKATGSFYTPEYIVKYIVKNTLEPLIKPMIEEAMMSEDIRKDLYKKLLSIKVLDPAMGSGHFLVEATDYIAREIIHAREIARQEELESEDVAENDIHWARREVVRNCIYGVDLNPMAVELAKLSLWLTTVAANKPLSFLDHHLRCGNSLIGAELDRLTVLPGRPPEETALWSFGLRSHTEGLLKRYSLMAALPDDSLQMVKWKEDQFRQIKEGELSRRLAQLSNVWLSTYFGNNVSDDDYYEMQNRINPEKFPDWSGLRSQEWFMRAQALAEEKRFFHWELEFPEAFQGEGRGFDVVIGNPPYFSMERVTYLQPVFEMLHSEIYAGKLDISSYFIKKGLDLIKEHGFVGYITARYFLEAIHGRKLRDFCSKNASIRQIVDFGNFQVFDANVLTIILLLERISVKSIHNNVEILKYDEITQEISLMQPYKGFDKFLMPLSNFTENPWFINESSREKFINKIKLVSYPLVEICRIGKGMESGLNEAFVVTKNTVEKWNLEPDLIKNHVQGKDLTRYSINHRDLYLIYNENIDNLTKFPFAEAYLTQFKDKLEKRKNFILGNCKWYTYGSPLNTDVYEQANEKLIVPYMATHARFGYDSCKDHEKFFTLTDTTIIVLKANNNYSLKYILSILNSSLLNYIHQRTSKLKRDGYYEYFSKTMERLPIRRISFTTPAPERVRLGAELQQLYAESKFAEILIQVDAYLPKDEVGNFISELEKSDVVHDLLAFLAERMQEMNQQKQQEIRGFLGWLEGYLGAKVEGLTPKTKLQGYYEHDYESFLAVLKKNKKKLAVDPARREPGAALKSEFEGSIAKLGPLRERIRLTDELIDAMVYRLYGLTQEEIRIVEEMH
jgi:type I restriction-modification system DNA methylase subunit